jgi:hypothetical protein
MDESVATLASGEERQHRVVQPSPNLGFPARLLRGRKAEDLVYQAVAAAAMAATLVSVWLF